MIQPLRKVHRKVFHLIAIIVPLVFAVGLANRQPRPAAAYMKGKLTEAMLNGATIWPSAALATRCNRGPGGSTVRVDILKPLRTPDPLLYFVASSAAPPAVEAEASPLAELPANALLLGAARDEAVLPLPADQGRLILYSLGNRKIVDQLAMEVGP